MNPKKLKERRERIQKLDSALKKLFPGAGIELKFKNPLQLLIAVRLSAQCTDRVVNKVTEKLFKKYKAPGDYARANIREFERDIKQTGFYRNKAKNILAAARMIKEEFHGMVPRTMEELLRLPGIARKSANVVLAEGYGVVAGITVDTHVIRFTKRYDLSDHKAAPRIEKDLMLLLPKKEWRGFAHRVIYYGRYLAPARRYDTNLDPLVKIYPRAAKKFRV